MKESRNGHGGRLVGNANRVQGEEMGQTSGEGDAAGKAVGDGSVRGAVSGNLALGWAWSQVGRGWRVREWGAEAACLLLGCEELGLTGLVCLLGLIAVGRLKWAEVVWAQIGPENNTNRNNNKNNTIHKT